jgi:probable HAF family extracellular repeat protein
VSLMLAAPLRADAQTYTVVDLGTLGGNRSRASSINDDGVVIGSSTTATGQTHVFRYRDGLMTDLDPSSSQSFAVDVTRSGLVLWERNIGTGFYPVLGGTGGDPLDLLEAYGLEGAGGMNNRGDIVGWRTSPPDGNHLTAYQAAVLVTAQSTINLGPFDEDRMHAWAINDSRQIVVQAFRHGHGGDGRTVLLQGGQVWEIWRVGEVRSDAAINGSGQVVGRLETDRGRRAFVFHEGRLTILDPLPGGDHSTAHDINDRGQIVGTSDLPDARGRAAVIFSHAGAHDLNSLIPSDSGWVLDVARSINETGQIVGHGRHNGQERAFLLNPVTGGPHPADGDTPDSVPSAPCLTPDPFVIMGGGVCRDGNWLPPTHPLANEDLPITTAAALPRAPTWCPPPDPFVALGGGVCIAGD